MRNRPHVKFTWHSLMARVRARSAVAAPAPREPLRAGHQGLASYVTGSADLVHAHAPARQAHRCSVELRFSAMATAGAWLRIVDAHEREVLTVPECAETVLVDLPAGRYRAHAVRAGRVEMLSFELAAGERLRFAFGLRE